MEAMANLSLMHSEDVQTMLLRVLDRQRALEQRVHGLELSVQRALVTMMPKVDDLLNRAGVRLPAPTASTTTTIAVVAPQDVEASAAAEQDRSESPLLPVVEHQICEAPGSLHVAATLGQTQTVLRLLAEGADPDARCQHGDTPLLLAAVGGHVETINALLEGGADAGKRGRLLRGPLHLTTAHGFLEASRRLLDAGADVDSQAVGGAAPLHLAAASGHNVIVEMLLDWGARLDVADRRGRRPLLLAARAGSVATVRLLLERGATVDMPDDAGETALYVAVRDRRWEVAALLVKAGACPRMGGAPSRTPLAMTAEADRIDLLEAMLAHPTIIPAEFEHALRVAASPGVVWALADANPTCVQGLSGEEALRCAARDGRQSVLEALLDADVNPDCPSRIDSEDAPIHLCAYKGSLECLTFLLDRGADINATGRYGKTALHLAAQAGHAQCLTLLLDRGANIDAKSIPQDTPLHWAAYNGHAHCVRLLLAAGACPNEQQDAGNTALDLAKTAEVRQILREAMTAPR